MRRSKLTNRTFKDGMNITRVVSYLMINLVKFTLLVVVRMVIVLMVRRSLGYDKVQKS